MSRRALIAGNWKMYKTPEQTEAFLGALLQSIGEESDRDVAVIPPFPCLPAAAKALAGSTVRLGAQNMHHEEEGAFTGEVSAVMLKNAGCSLVVLGHSERRQFFYETSALCNKKIKRAFVHQLTPIYCIGETLAQREEGRMLEVVLEQLAEGLAGLTVEQIASMAIAYEPVWAIGTGKTATPAQAQEAHAEIRKHLADRFGKDAADKCRIQYGGSVKPSNIDELMAQPDIDGALVGGASLSVSDFARIVLFKRAKALESAIK